MADFRITPNDPSYETELANQEHASDKFMGKLFFIVFIIVAVISVWWDKAFLMVVAVCFLIASIYKLIHAAYIKSRYTGYNRPDFRCAYGGFILIFSLGP